MAAHGDQETGKKARGEAMAESGLRARQDGHKKSA
jgi:hypothetical protein